MKTQLWRFAIWFIVLTILIVGGVAIYPNFRQQSALSGRNVELQAQIEAKRREIRQYEEYQRRFRSDADFVEMIARQNHRVFPGELVFVFDDD